MEVDVEGGRPRSERCEGVRGMSEMASFEEKYGRIGRSGSTVLMRK